MAHLLLAIIYISFISLGLPDCVLGAAWPTMYPELGVSVSYAGGISLTIALGTVVSALLSDRITKRFGAGIVTAVSVGMTALALFGFSTAHSFGILILWAIPYGLGAGTVDAALNNFVALHYTSRHMSWLHCMWGVGTIIGPNILSYALVNGMTWNDGYRSISFLQVALTAVIVLSLPLWKRKTGFEETENVEDPNRRTLSLREILRIPGAKEVLIMFFCYCALEQTALLWGGSYLNLVCGLSANEAARFAASFCIGITAGRAINGFLTMKFTDTFLIRMGEILIFVSIMLTALPFIPAIGVTSSVGIFLTMTGLVGIGLGCAPVYPCVIHSTPAHFGADKSQAIIGVQMASAYIGICAMPPLFGLIADYVNAGLLPVYLLIILVAHAVLHERLEKICAA